VIPDLFLINLDAPPLFVRLPVNFPDDAQTPYFLYGDRVKWRSVLDTDKTDTGVVIGRFYAFVQHQNQWAWKYLVFLDPDSYSCCFCTTADTAWEQDLEPLD
jgi:hypothetical protein